MHYSRLGFHILAYQTIFKIACNYFLQFSCFAFNHPCYERKPHGCLHFILFVVLIAVPLSSPFIAWCILLKSSFSSLVSCHVCFACSVLFLYLVFVLLGIILPFLSPFLGINQSSWISPIFGLVSMLSPRL